MKKILTTIALGSTLLTSSLMAYGSCDTGFDEGLVQMVKSSAEEINETRTDFIKLGGIQKACPIIMGRYGVGLNLTIKSPSSGVNYTYDVNSFCINVDNYIEHIYKRYVKEDNIELLYEFVGFITRVSQETLIKSKDSEFMKNFSIGSNMIDTVENLKNNFFSYNIARIMFRDGYQGSEKNIGFNDPQFHKWLGYVLSKNFNDADKVIEKNMNGEMLRYRTIKLCETSFGGKEPDYVKIFYKNGFNFNTASTNEVNEYLCESTNNAKSCFDSGATYFNDIQNYIRAKELIFKSCDLGYDFACKTIDDVFPHIKR